MRNNIETLFIASVLQKEGWHQVETATGHEAKYKHWHARIDGLKFYIQQAHPIEGNMQYDYVWVQLRNLDAHGGWVVGDAECIVFELENEFLIVDRIELFNLITQSLLPEVGSGPYQRYQRENRSDLLTLVPVNDLRQLTGYTVSKFSPDEV